MTENITYPVLPTAELKDLLKFELFFAYIPDNFV